VSPMMSVAGPNDAIATMGEIDTNALPANLARLLKAAELNL